jgi:hypothetical protein
MCGSPSKPSRNTGQSRFGDGNLSASVHQDLFNSAVNEFDAKDRPLKAPYLASTIPEKYSDRPANLSPGNLLGNIFDSVPFPGDNVYF